MAKLAPWGIDYFEHLIAELNGLDSPPENPINRRAKVIIDKFKTSPDTSTQSDLLELEQALLALQPTEVLLQRAPTMRLRYRDAVGEKQFSFYKPAGPPLNADDLQGRRTLLADLENLVSSLHWRLALAPHREDLQRDITKNVINWLVIYTTTWAIAVALTWYFTSTPFLSVLCTVLYTGIVGGYVSSLRRMQSIPTDSDTLLSLNELMSGRYFLWLSPLFGAIFAAVLMVLFMSTLIGGPLFPKFTKLEYVQAPGSTASQAWLFLTQLTPESSVEYAKLFLWSFVAGFAERFVPDALDRIIQRAEESNKATTGGIDNPPPMTINNDTVANTVKPEVASESKGAGDSRVHPEEKEGAAGGLV